MLTRTTLSAAGLAPAALLIAALPTAAAAQSLPGPYLAAEATTDYRQRGLSGSDGDPALTAIVAVPVTQELELQAVGSTLRESARHGGADLGVDLAATYRLRSGGWSLSAGPVARLFTGGDGGLNYVELAGRAGYTLGPAAVAVGASYAPAQDAIGGDNLYLHADADVGVPGTPFTLLAGVGHSSGSVDDRSRSARLRPGGSYWDYRLGAEYVMSPFALGARFTTTSIDREDRIPSPYADRHDGSRFALYIRIQN
ncbi:conserved hypothetical protein [Altererythrobacter sp. B11]|uniref:TorF family putative porin n=1 Tax=Altererythrobacter sp. B11 TaxID=2060312 RepID=UPI000DC72E7B|nr:TorF family putative porin [Altererythrobacter sp. B11]BBC72306.1 conserved hypothetical protein [Altererythrobacter sp. B11]